MTMQVHDILSAITEASGALQREPQLQSRVVELERSLNTSQTHAQELELRIASYKDEIASLNGKVRSLEVERDDAGFRELEAIDKLDDLRNMVKAFQANVEVVMPKVVHVAEATSLVEMKEAVKPESLLPLPETSTQNQSSLGDRPNVTEVSYQSGKLSGQSESPLSAISTKAQSPAAPLTAESMESVLQPRPYEGKTYSQVRDENYDRPFITYFDWIDGGGTQADYYR